MPGTMGVKEETPFGYTSMPKKMGAKEERRDDMKRRVVVTGMGAITPIGNDVDSFWNGLKEKKVGIGEITQFDTTDYKAKLAAEVKDFDPKEYMDPKAAKRMERFVQLAVAATKEALTMSGIDMEKEDPYRVGVSVGSGIGSLQALEREHKKLLEKGPGRVNPLLVPLMISNMAAGNVGIQFGLKGKCINVVTACATGTNCIGEAYRSIQYGEAEVMVAGGTEASVTPIGVAGFTALTALSTAEDPLRASIPFDKDRSGFVMGEGAGVVVLEELEHAIKRGAVIYGEVAGYGATCDAYHITSPAEDGSGAARAMIEAIKDAGITPEDLDYINAHGTSTHHNDLFETLAIKAALGDHANKVKISSTKSMVGHLLGGAGGVEFIVCVKSIEDGFVHATAGLEEEGEGCDLNYTKGEGIACDVNYAISNSFGFGGHNASILVKKYEA
jgi:3-oxoacyl-[acyl-carrier-protein] synthase II